ncbi:MAG TPA: cytochrome b/b6 domain-containing protein [Gammaproteobacteria bacterium]|nr:cytochrome b/b6 domain-containing protein [Gammaproteobacteria bacterium]
MLRRTARRRGPLIYRHTVAVRVMHWINVGCLLVLLLSGFQIFNARPDLYWGQASDFDAPLLSMGAHRAADGSVVGTTTVLGHRFDTTGVLGASRSASGEMEARGFPHWLTIPGPRWLAMGRTWHFFFAWLFVVNGMCFIAYSLWTRHLQRDLVPTRTDWRGIGRSIVDHLRLRHPTGEAARRYNVLQRLAYLVVLLAFGPGIVLMGLAMSPTMDSVLGWLLHIVGGRQSARTLHFLLAFALVAFVAIHVFEVIVTGVWNNLRSMITGYYRLPVAREDSRDES